MKRSFGVACCRFNIDKHMYEILLVHRRCTYAFADFVAGKYDHSDTQYLMYLFNRMSSYERIAISSGIFSSIWFLKWGDLPDTESWRREREKAEKFYSKWNLDTLKKLLSNTTKTFSLWELPKGRKDSKEEDIECAIREFSEETNIPKSFYKLLGSSVVNCYNDCSINYHNTYYIAAYTGDRSLPKIDYRKNVSEVIDIRWMNIMQIEALGDHRLYSLAKDIIKKIKREGSLKYIYQKSTGK